MTPEERIKDALAWVTRHPETEPLSDLAYSIVVERGAEAIRAAVAEERDRLRSLLIHIQWRGPDAEGDRRCPECGGYQSDGRWIDGDYDDSGHAGDCQLAAAIRARGETTT